MRSIKILLLFALISLVRIISAQNTNNEYYQQYQKQQQQLNNYNQKIQQERQYNQNGTYTPQKRGYTNQEIINQQKAREQAVKDRNNPYYSPKLKAGIMTYNGSIFGSFSNGWVQDVGGNSVAYFNKGFFYTTNQKCIGGINGYNIIDCRGYTIYSVKQGAVYDNRGYVVCRINGEQLIFSNGNIITIAQLNMNSLGAYLLVFN